MARGCSVGPERHRALIATAAGAGLRWGEVAGLMDGALDLDAGTLRVIRTVVEVAGHRSFKPFPKSAAGRREVPLPPWSLRLVREHVEHWPTPPTSPVFANEIDGPLGRTAFRARVWRPALVRAGLIGDVRRTDEGYVAIWTDREGEKQEPTTRTEYPSGHRGLPAPLRRAALPRPAPLLRHVAGRRRRPAE